MNLTLCYVNPTPNSQWSNPIIIKITFHIQNVRTRDPESERLSAKIRCWTKQRASVLKFLMPQDRDSLD